MAENKKTDTNQPTGPFVQINAQYIKDLSFETPNHPDILLEMKKAPEISINVDVQAKKIQAEDAYTVDLLVKAQATDPDNKKTIFLCEVDYGSLVTLKVAKEQVEPFLLVEIPHLLFPYVRNLISDMTRDGGLPPLFLNPIDFSAIYRQKVAEKQQQIAESEKESKKEILN
jgi:preprotein translocase subunit SecB